MKTQIATDREQSKRLLACGVKPETADMEWEKDRIIDDFWHLRTSPFLADAIPAWSLSRLLSLLPKEIDIDGYKYRISIYIENPDEPVIGNQWCLYYKPKNHNERSPKIDDVTEYAPDLVECAVLMVEWLKNNGYSLNNIEQ